MGCERERAVRTLQRLGEWPRNDCRMLGYALISVAFAYHSLAKSAFYRRSDMHSTDLAERLASDIGRALLYYPHPYNDVWSDPLMDGEYNP